MDNNQKLNLSCLIKLVYGYELNPKEAEYIKDLFILALNKDLHDLIELYGKGKLSKFIKSLKLKKKDERFLLNSVKVHKFIN